MLSMTGFGSGEGTTGSITVMIELRSVNHRFLDVSLKLPGSLAVYEGDIRKFLKDNDATRLVVPHRQNRCVVFNSNLLHRTDDISFEDNYADRRINIAMLFGRREKAG